MATTDCPGENALADAAMAQPGDALRGHLADCPACRRKFDELRAVLSGLNLLSTASADLAAIPAKRSAEGHPSAIGHFFVLGVQQQRDNFTLYRGLHSRIRGDEVAIFLARAPWPADAGSEGRFRSACLPLDRLRHPAIARAVDIGFFEERPYLLIERAPGRPLARLLRDRSLSPRAAAAVGARLADALAAAHRIGLIHGSLRVESIVLDERGRPTIIDFGTSLLGENPSISSTETDVAALADIVRCMAPQHGWIAESFADAADLAKACRRSARSGIFGYFVR